MQAKIILFLVEKHLNRPNAVLGAGDATAFFGGQIWVKFG